MPDSLDLNQHVKPFVYESLSKKALHFTIGEIQSRMLLKDPCALDLEYTRLMMGFLLFVPDPAGIAMIGLGGGSLAKFCHRYLERTRIQVVEVNPHVIALRNEFHVPPDDERFTVVRDDGAKFVRSGTARFDVLLVDGFDSQGQPAKLSSQRFYQDCHGLLQPGGVMAVNLHRGDPRFNMQVQRIQRSFGDAVLVVDDTDNQSNSIVFACKDQPFERPAQRAMRPPEHLHADASVQLLGAFSTILTAHRAQATNQ